MSHSNLDSSGGNLGPVKLLNQAAFSTNGTAEVLLISSQRSKVVSGIRMIFYVCHSTVGSLSKSDVIM